MAARYERTLAHAVIRQAILDTFSATVAGASDEDQNYERHRAMRFLTAPRGDEWAASRDHWCHLADIDADELRMHIVDVLNGHRDIEMPPDDRAYRLNGHEKARDLWRREKEQHAAYLENARRIVAERRASKAEQRMRAAWADAGRIIEEANERIRYGT